MAASLHSKLIRLVHLIFIAVAVPVLLVEDPDAIYTDKSKSESYRKHILALLVGYHLSITLVSLINTDWRTLYILWFCLIFGVFQTFIADHYLCSAELMTYPLNSHPNYEFLGHCIPEYMVRQSPRSSPTHASRLDRSLRGQCSRFCALKRVCGFTMSVARASG